jgi:hypothetical protein
LRRGIRSLTRYAFSAIREALQRLVSWRWPPREKKLDFVGLLCSTDVELLN